ncbi:hypothetical protein BD309DRAFT_134991 [Dichomitus squalens]|nr:hypothetical protein BD309DRAFT_134991 [Dichomitus squalens]
MFRAPTLAATFGSRSELVWRSTMLLCLPPPVEKNCTVYGARARHLEPVHATIQPRSAPNHPETRLRGPLSTAPLWHVGMNCYTRERTGTFDNLVPVDTSYSYLHRPRLSFPDSRHAIVQTPSHSSSGDGTRGKRPSRAPPATIHGCEPQLRLKGSQASRHDLVERCNADTLTSDCL